ncbi:flagellin [Iodobacter sp.]|uniref:flagellin N-terminal helical domain-containing protein n=1 Tax=Iodobacter sp. TaxID=1915058 RepID=UPI0025DC5054|nr:flagellin [Iodobacter sp.]
MLSLHTNAAALSTQRNLGTSQSALTTSMTRLGTGLRINSAMDDAAGLQIATRMDAQSRGMQAAMKNTQNGISMLQTAEGALGEVSSILLRMKDLATEGANGTATADDKSAMQAEFAALGKEMGNIIKNTSFGGDKLLTKTTGKLAAGAVDFQIGASKDETMAVDLKSGIAALATSLTTASTAYRLATDPTAADVTAKTTADAAVTAAAALPRTTPTEIAASDLAIATADTGLKTLLNGAELTVAGGANAQISNLDAALKAVGTVRSDLGANANRLDHVYNNLGNMDSNTKMAKGRIMDTDYATEQAKMTSNQMLMQAGTSMLKQSGSMSQMVMSLMQ